MTAGMHAVDEFQEQVYCYIDGVFDEIEEFEQMNLLGTKYTFYFLREVQSFITEMWKIRDNSIYVRDGYLICYKKNLEDGRTYKASLSEIFTNAGNSSGQTTFTDAEIRGIAKQYEISDIKDVKLDEIDYKTPTDDHFYKKSKSTRIYRAEYYMISARARSSIPMKIVSYCTALECLFTTTTTEVSHRIAERVACLLGDTSVHKKEIYTTVKKAYDIRSTVVHGSLIKVNDGETIRISAELDSLLRLILTKHREVFTESDAIIDSIFIDLLFKEE